MKIFTIFILFLVCITSIQSQTDSNNPYAYLDVYPKHTIGLTGSTMSGTGMFYSFAPNDKLRFKISGVPFYNRNNDDEYTWTSLGFNFQFSFIENKEFRFYGLLAYSNWFEHELATHKIYGYYPTYKDSSYQSDIQTGRNVFGFGIGIDKTLWKRFVIGAEIGYQLHKLNTDSLYTKPVGKFWEKYFGLGGGVSLGFIFY